MYTAKRKNLNGYYQRWLNSTEDSLYKSYSQPSQYKLQAWARCKSIMREYNGSNIRITGHNSSQFSAAFVTDDTFYVITKDNIYSMPLSEVR